MSKYIFRNLLLVACLFFLFVFSGCFGRESSGSDSVEENSYQGEIQEMTTKISGIDATHVLVTTAKERVYLRSVLFDLNEYVEKNVRVFGIYSEGIVASNPVDLLTVTQIDLLGGLEEVSYLGYVSNKIGLSFNYPDSFFKIIESDKGLALVHDGSSVDRIEFKVFKVSPELDDELYIKKTYSNQNFSSLDDLGFSNIKGVSNRDSGESKIVYIFTFDSYFYEVSTFSNNSVLNDYLFEILSSIKYVGIPTIKFEDPEVVLDKSDSNIETLPSTSKPVGESKFKSTIESFYLKATSVLSDYSSAVSFAFTDNNYFYIVYNNDSGLKRRALIKYSANTFELIARFEPGTKEDWKLVSGNNVAYDRPQTFVPINLTGSVKEVEIKKGFRYFESLPLSFSSQYPQNWYYSRQENTYLFSDKPLDESSPVARMYVSNVTNLPAYSENAGTITYNVKLSDFTVSVSGASSYAQFLKVMAESIQEIKD